MHYVNHIEQKGLNKNFKITKDISEVHNSGVVFDMVVTHLH